MNENPPSSRLCASCGYDTAGVSERGTFACPECGKDLSAVHGPFLKGPAVGGKHIITIITPALIASGAIALEFAVLAACVALSFSGKALREVSPLLVLIVAFIMLATFGVGLGYTVRASDAIKMAYVPRRLHERWWWYNVAVFGVVALIIVLTLMALASVASIVM